MTCVGGVVAAAANPGAVPDVSLNESIPLPPMTMRGTVSR
jgi:hypothetical protein